MPEADENRYVTHKRDDGIYQPLSNHIYGTADRAAEFAKVFQAEAHGRKVGRLHDIGKYSANGQARQRDPEHSAKADHSTAGAQEAAKGNDGCAALVVAGHHAGLPDMGSGRVPEDGTLMHRLRKSLTGRDDPSAWRSEIDVGGENCVPDFVRHCGLFGRSFYTRMLFSCLVDADFLDTERFMMKGKTLRELGESISVLNGRMQTDAYRLLDVPNKSAINEKRCEILKSCLNGGNMSPGLYTLTVPTGGGKTRASLAFALSHAAAHGLRRVIYVIPYTSIIEQNADVFAEILGRDNVLEHHSNVDFQSDEGADNPEALKRMLACENWDAPVVVTTAVQFFESLFAAKPSRCRKLHNIAGSVVIFDEAQMLPVPYIEPCVAAITELIERYHVTAVLCTATQPALNDIIHRHAPNLPVREIVSDPDGLYAFFRRVRYQNEGTMAASDVAAALAGQEQALCIVNSRKRAKELYEQIKADGVFYLTTLLTPYDRKRKLDEIRRRLTAGERCVTVATSLIEAGVDVDFPMVWREICGLDSVIQAAGRCNRENRRPREQSVVHIFSFEGEKPRQFAQNISSMRSVMSRGGEIDTGEAIRLYYEDLFLLKGQDALDRQKIVEACKDFQFRTVAEKFRLIDENTVTVYIPTGENEDLLRALRSGVRSRSLFRELGRYAVNIYPQHYRALESAMEKIGGGWSAEGFDVLADRSLYSSESGLAKDVETGIGLFA